MANILIVDDSNVERKKFAQLIGKEHYLTFASSGEDGVAIACKEKPDLIIMDFIMPDVDGVFATGFLKSNEATKNIPIIMVTSIRQKEEIMKAVKSGINDFLLKPYQREHLVEKIDYHLRQKR